MEEAWEGGPPSPPDGEEPPRQVLIEADLASAINYACWQNSVPIVRSLKIANNTDAQIESLRLELSTVPAFARRKTWSIDRISPGEEFSLSDHHVQLDAEFLEGLNEAERGVVTLRLLDGTGALLADTHQDTRLLARDEWGGFSSMAAIAAAFVMPNDPAIAEVMKQAAGVLATHGFSSALDGYQTGDPRRAYMLSAAIWSAVAGRGLTYAEPPRSFEKTGQKVRLPSVVIRDGLATCFDSSLLFASALEAVGLNPFVVLLDGHSFTGVWLVKRTFPNLLETDASEVRKALAAHEAITFETTAVTHSPPATFETAVALARKATTEQEEDRFVAAIDIARARSSQILPLASHRREPMEASASGSHEGAALPLPPMPSFDAIPAEQAEEKPTTPEGRIERWQRKLLDLSLRNRLLNFRPTKQTIPFLCPDVPFLEDHLANGARIRVISLPQQNPQGERDKAIHLQTTGTDLDIEFAVEALQRDELPSPLEAKELDARLTELYRRARNDLNEGGSNTLFLAVGFLRWKKSPDDERTYRAPLLLVPVKLERRSATSRFHLLHHEDEVRFNATLVQMLKKDFALNLAQFEGELPRDDSGIDVPQVLETARRAVREVAGFEVVNEVALSTFSFAKYLMWKDLVDRTDALRNNRVVRHLIDNPDKAFESAIATPFPNERTIDATYHPKEIINPLPADSSQLAAMLAAAEGHDFILIGPPGTGKSQTITNMIAQCLASDRSVLFVAEKAAALNVVYRRLRQNGLSDYCLELHSNKAERRTFLGQLRASWEASAAQEANGWIDINEKLRLRQDELNGYVESLHRRSSSGWTVFQALGVSVRGRDRFAPELAWGEAVEHDETALQALRQLVSDLALSRKAVRHVPALELVVAPDWSVRWQQSLIAACKHVQNTAGQLKLHIRGFCASAGIRRAENLSLSDIHDLVSMAGLLTKSRGVRLDVVFEQQFEHLKFAVGALAEAVDVFREAAEKLSGTYEDDTLPRIPIDNLEGRWREACATVWPRSFFARRKIRKLLTGYSSGGDADPERDLPQLRVMQRALKALEGNPLSTKVPAWKGIRTDLGELRDHFALAEDMRSALDRAGRISGDINAIVDALGQSISSGDPNDAILSRSDELRASVARFERASQGYAELGGRLPDESPQSEFLDAVAHAMDGITANQSALQSWSDWCGRREMARAHGLGPFVDAIEAEDMSPDDLEDAFELAYARWWLPEAIDSDDLLRQFKSFRHEDALRQFRELDDRARSIAASQVRRALVHGLPAPQDVPRRSELGLLRHQMELQRPSKSIREMIAAMPETFAKLAPCLLMSPLSIAQYLPTNQALFDLVIFDEASQITTWDAIGSIARGRQTIIVGDPKQLPPTNFFGRSDDGEDDQDQAYYERDLESILDEARASGLPDWRLNWHYRSRHESLIAFSNWHYYANRLVTFPSPVTLDRAVHLEHLPSATYDRGKSRTNRAEAEAIVKDASGRMVEWLDLPELDRPTLGVITFNSQQQTLIDDLFDKARRENPDLEWFFSEDRIEPTIVRNLENVQGDERDVMMFSITYGHDHAGKLTMAFGAINRDGGERRLNVAVTRAREELAVYSSITADKIDVRRARGLGVQHLKAFLDYAERGMIALPAQHGETTGSFESPFEEAVGEALSNAGWHVRPQVGVSGYRIDLGVVHPDKAGVYLAGIECDGATYHRAATARDRDKVREQVLRNLGWTILRIWSLDWWYSADEVRDRIVNELSDLLDVSRQEDIRRRAEAEARAEARLQTRAQTTNRQAAELKTDVEEAEEPPTSPSNTDIAEGANLGVTDAFRLIASGSGTSSNDRAADDAPLFRIADLSGFHADPDQFFEFRYRQTIHDMVAAIMTAEAPIREDVLAKRIARAHGWLRTGARIRDQLALHLRDLDRTDEQTGRFLWSKGSVRDSIAYRVPASDEDRRSVAEIAVAELVGCALANSDLLGERDPALSFARLIGLDRLAQPSRQRLEQALGLARAMISK